MEVYLPVHTGTCQDSLYLRSKNEIVTRHRVEEWPDPVPVTREKKLSIAGIPYGKCPLAVEVSSALLSFFQVHPENDLGVGPSCESVSLLLQFLPKFNVVEDLAIESDPQRAVFDGHRLVTTGQVNDAEPSVRQA